MNVFNNTNRVTARFLAALTACAMILSALPVHFFVSEAAASETLIGPDGAEVLSISPYESSSVDASGSMNLNLSFTFNAEALDGIGGDKFIYGWKNDVDNEVLGSVVGASGADPSESGLISVPLPAKAEAVNLQVYVTVTADTPTVSDKVIISDLTVTGEKKNSKPIKWVNDPKVRICHATKSDGNPYTNPTVDASSIVNLPNGHNDHDDGGLGNKGDIIPPFDYDPGTGTTSYPGKNWLGDYIDFWERSCSTNDDDSQIPLQEPLKPIFECWEDNHDGTGTGYFGYLNQNDELVDISVGDKNKVNGPLAPDAGQPTTFAVGRTAYVDDGGVFKPENAAFSVEFPLNGSITWTLTDPAGDTRTASAGTNGKECPAPQKPPVCQIGDNLLTNGSFEEPVADENSHTGGFWELFASNDIPGWTVEKVSDNTLFTLELWNNLFGGASDGDQNVELDGDGELTKVSQTVTTIPGATYELRFDFAAREKTDGAENDVDALIDGVLLMNASGTETDWETYSKEFVADDNSTTVTLKDVGTPNGVGSLVDNTVLCLVEEPEDMICHLPYYVEFDDESDDDTYSTSTATGLVIEEVSNGYKIGLYDDGRNGVYRVKGTITFPNGIDTSEFSFVEEGGFAGLEQSHLTYPDVANLSGQTIDFDLFVNGANDVFTITDDALENVKNCDVSTPTRPQPYQCDMGLLYMDDETNAPKVSSLHLVDEVTGATTLFADYETHFHSVLAVDKNEVVYSIERGTGDLVTLDNNSGDYTVVGPTGLNDKKPVAMEFAPDGTLYVLTQNSDELFEVDPTDGVTTFLHALDLNVTGGDLVFEGDQIVYVKSNGKVYSIDTGTYAETVLGTLSVNPVTSAATKDGTHYAYTRNDDFVAFTLSPFVEVNVVNQTGPFGFGDGSFCPATPDVKTCEVTLVSDTTDYVVEKDDGAKILSSIHARWTAIIDGANWIWGDDPVLEPTNVDETQTFVKKFGFMGDVTKATLYLATDNYHSVSLNDNASHDGLSGFKSDTQVEYDVTNEINQGNNKLEISVTNIGADHIPTADKNPAGLMYKLHIEGEVDGDTDCSVPYVPEPEPECLIEGYKYNVYGEPLQGWEIGLVRYLSYEPFTSAAGSVSGAISDPDPTILATGITGSDGYYCLNYQQPGSSTQTEDSANDLTYVYWVFEEMKDGWKNVKVEVDDEERQSQADSFFDVLVEVDLDNDNQVDFYNQEIDDDLVCEPRVNLVANGGFEVPEVDNDYDWDIFDLFNYPAMAWDVAWMDIHSGTPDTPFLELHAGVNSWSPYEGEQYAELDSDWEGPGFGGSEDASVAISQTIDTIPGEEYILSWAYSPRPNKGADENKLKILVDDGSTADTSNQRSGAGLDDTDWTTDDLVFTAVGNTTKITFQDEGDGNSEGTFLDDVALYCDPDDDQEEPEMRCEIDVDEDYVKQGSEVELTWTTYGGDYYEINHGVDSVAASGDTTVEVDNDSTYVLTVYDNYGEEDQASITCDVFVDTYSGGGGGRRRSSDDDGEENAPIPQVLGDQVSLVPQGAPDTGAGGAAPVAVDTTTLTAIVRNNRLDVK